MKYIIEITRWLPINEEEDKGFKTFTPRTLFWTGDGETFDLNVAKLYGNKGAATFAQNKLRFGKGGWEGLFTRVAGVSDALVKEIEFKQQYPFYFTPKPDDLEIAADLLEKSTGESLKDLAKKYNVENLEIPKFEDLYLAGLGVAND